LLAVSQAEPDLDFDRGRSRGVVHGWPLMLFARTPKQERPEIDVLEAR
jgi:hypothetical protein